MSFVKRKIRRRRRALYGAVGLLYFCLSCQSASDGPDLGALLAPYLAGPRIRVYFSDPRPEVAPALRFAARNRLVQLLDGARRNIQLWVYGLDEPEIIAALLRARQRGLSVTLVGSPDQKYESLAAAAGQAGVPLTPALRNRTGLQHVKLAWIDEAVLFSGTGNFTRSGFYHNNNLFLEFAASGGDDAATMRALVHALAHETDAFQAPYFAPAPGVRVALAPANGRLIQSRIVQAILGARRRIRFMIFSHTDPVITAALYLQARRGIQVQGIFDDATNRGALPANSEAARLNANLGLAANAALYLDGNRQVFAEDGVFHGGHLHHKTLLIDDDLVLTGSYNWSLSARDRNLEVLFAVRDLEVARQVHREFERRLREAAILPRPPFPGPLWQSSAKAAALLSQRAGQSGAEASLCVPEDLSELPLTLFAGQGPYFRAYHYGAAPGQQRCRNFAGLHAASSGLVTGADYLLAPDFLATDPPTAAHADWRAVAGAVYTGGPIPGPPREIGTDKTAAIQTDGPRPCADAGRCRPLEMRRVSLKGGWLWLRGEAAANDFAKLYVWNRDGFAYAAQDRYRTPVQRVSPDFYRFAPPDAASSDALIFLEDDRGGLAVGCVQAGRSLAAPLREFLAAFAYESGRGHAPACVIGE